MKTIFAVNCLIIIIAFALSGCAASRLPERLPESSMQIIQSVEFPFSIAVEKYKYPVYSEELKTNLSNTKNFKMVENANQISKSDLVAKVEDRIYGTACIPWLTFITLGIVPTIAKENHGDSFSLSSPDNPNNKVMITFRYRSTTVLGWAGLFLNLHPDWWMCPKSSNRYLDSLSYEIAIKEKKIKALADKK
jgi:hypothetical protein